MADQKVFTSKLVRTSNIVKELLSIAKEYKLSVHDLDFRLIKMEMYIKKTASSEGEEKKESNSKKAAPKADDNFREATREDLNRLQDDTKPADPELVVKQVYDAEIFPVEEPLFPKLELTISGNKSLTAVYATIKAGSVIEATGDLSNDLRDYFNRRKLRTHILIDIWDREMVTELAKLSASIEVNGSVAFEEDRRILISKSLHSVETIHDKLILHFENKNKNEDDYGRIDYKKRGFITAVEAGELLITYRKPITGQPGRNCKGEFIEVPEADASHVPKFTVDEATIEIKEDEKKIEYFAKKNGYIDIDKNSYYVKEELEVSEISFKSTGNVNAGLNTDIAIHVKEDDSMRDAIGMGVEVEATEVNVEGNVGSNSTVTAQKIKIGGQTHKSSVLMAPEIDINLHRGLAKGKEVQVRRLEQGRIEADEVFVEQAAGGEIIGRHVTIEILASHVNVIASESITIKKMRGSENVLTIDQAKVGDNVQAFEELEDSIEEKRIEINRAKKKLDEQKRLYKRHESAIKEIKERLVAYKKSGVKLPDAFVRKYKEFQSLHNDISQQEREYNLLLEMFEDFQKQRGSFQSSIMDARVTNYDVWKGHNEVNFHLSSPAQELSYVPAEGLKESIIMLKYDQENDEYSIICESADMTDPLEDASDDLSDDILQEVKDVDADVESAQEAEMSEEK